MMFYPIYKRTYFLKENGGLRKYFFSSFSKEKLQRTNQFFDHQKIDQLVKSVKNDFWEEIKKNKLREIFWNQADEEKKQAVLFSYWFKKNNGKQVGNIEIGQLWINYQDYQWPVTFKKFFKALNLTHLNHMIEVLIRRTGKHRKNLRFANIHLTVDKIGKKKVYGIHFDGHYPKSSIKELFNHWLKDDIRS
jgi:hypothetical protein